ncbi:MAG: hypothetical protein B7X67_12455, partial [Rhizobiales bacterium 39-66-18]
GGTVNVTNSGFITTSGVDARGIFAQSVGGGGGTAAAGQAAGTDDYQLNLSVGGKGGSGGDGGAVTVVNSVGASITTAADGAHGIEAQSVGGGGGSGGTASSDPAGALAGVLADTIESELKAILAAKLPQYAASEALKLSFPTTEANIAVGGAGGAAGNGEDVTVTNAGSITTLSDAAFGIFAQSVGGGGGNGGGATLSGSNVINVNVGVGGAGGAAGTGNLVTVGNTSLISTQGDSAFGILAQSVGGGGGVGGLAVDSTSLSLTASITVGGSTAANANNNNAQQGATGGADTVQITNSGTIKTAGSEAHAIVGQAIGGGGGVFIVNPEQAGLNGPTNAEIASLENQIVQGLLGLGVDLNAIAAAYAQQLYAANGTLALTIGGSALTSGGGGTVNITHTGTVTTTGDNAFGILAQSIGGGGGFATDGAGPTMPVTVTGGVGGSGAGAGGNVNILLGGGSSISTTGTGAIGIFAQSIGGGGGYSGAMNTSGMSILPPSANPDVNMLAGVVSIAMAPNTQGGALISTTGANAHGIFAQSLSGGGGAIGSTQGIALPPATGPLRGAYGLFGGGGVNIDVTGTISATGAGAAGIFAQSGFQATNGAIIGGGGTINVNFTGTLVGGSGSGAALVLQGGNIYNTVTFGAGSKVSALSGTAIIGTYEGFTITNAGTLSGNVDLTQAGASTFQNVAGAHFNPGPLVGLGTSTTFEDVPYGGSLTNAGTLNPGGRNVELSTMLQGNFTQSTGGVLGIDINAAVNAGQTNDVLNVSGTTTLGGSVQPLVGANLLPLTYTILSSTGAMTGSAQVIQPSALGVISFGLDQQDNTLLLTPTANFTPSNVSLTANEAAMAQSLQQSWNATSTGLSSVFASLANVQTAAGYERALQNLSGDQMQAAAVNQTRGARASLNAALSCPVFSGTGTLLAETDCTWARVIGSRAEQYADRNGSGFTLDALTYRIGTQKEVMTDWFVGATVGYSDTSLTTNNGFGSSDGAGADGALSVKHQVGPWLFSLAGHAGFGSYDNTRNIFLGGNRWIAEGSASVFTAGARARASYELAFANWYLRPYADLDLLYTYMPGYSETQAGPLNLSISSLKEWTLAFSPAVELGARIDLGPDYWLRPYGSVGVTFLSNDSLAFQSRLAGAAPSVPSFTNSVPLPATLLDVTAGLQLVNAKGYEVRAEYKAQTGNDFLAQELSARLSVPF